MNVTTNTKFQRFPIPSMHGIDNEDHYQTTFLASRNFYPVNDDALVDDLLTPIGIDLDIPLPLISSFHAVRGHSHSIHQATDVETSDCDSVCTSIFDDPLPMPVKSKKLPIGPNTDQKKSPDALASDHEPRFKPFHQEKWSVRYKELVHFHRENGHAAVPHTYPRNQQLARWIKRQRRQHKLLLDGLATTLTSERIEMLNSLGFVWDSHDVHWREKFIALMEYKKATGDCNVPSNYHDKKLATWVKCQRRQYKLHVNGKSSSMTQDRIHELTQIGFKWEIRSVPPRKNVNTSSPSIDNNKKDASTHNHTTTPLGGGL